jgi:N-ethylmaleimide reductase
MQQKKASSGHKLFKAFQLGPHHLQNRIAMAPLTRKRSTIDHMPVPIMVDYYRQRATAGLIVSEATNISHEGVGYTYTPGIWNNKQVEAWKPVTEAVHEAGGRIFCQLWHCGRHSHSSMQPDGKLPLAPSAIPDGGRVGTLNGYQPAEVPRAMTSNDIERTVSDYARAAFNAREAGFDGVEIHAANGYLIHQFLMQSSNERDDEYGGGFENRSRFLFQVLEAVISAWDGGHTGIRLSPSYYKYGMSDPHSVELFEYVIKKLNDYDILYLHLTEPYLPIPEEFSHLLLEVAPNYRKEYRGALLSCGNHNRESALNYIEQDIADMIVFGKAFISNPELVKKLINGTNMTPWDVSTFYTGGEKGYTDYR